MPDDTLAALNALAARVTRLEDHRVSDIREADMRHAENTRNLAAIKSSLDEDRKERKETDAERIVKLNTIQAVLDEVRINTALTQGATEERDKVKGTLFALLVAAIGGGGIVTAIEVFGTWLKAKAGN